MNHPEGYKGKLRQLLEEAHRLKFSEPQKALEMANLVYVQALKSSDDSLEAASLYALGVCNELISNYPQAMLFLSEAIKLSHQLGEKKIMGDSLNCVGIINDNLNNYSNALKAYFRALKIYEELQENKKIAIVISNIGLIYSNIKDYRNALKFYSQALDIAEEENDKESLLVTNINIGLTHNLLGNHKASLNFLNDALELALEKNDKHRTSLALDNIAETNIHINNNTEAYRLFEESRKIKLELDDRKGLVKIFGTVGRLKLLENKIDEAKDYLEKAVSIAEELGLKKSIYELHHNLSEAFEEEKDTESALRHLKLAYKKELEFIHEEAEMKARNITTQLEIEQAQKEAEIQKLKNVELAKALEDVKKLNVNLKELNEEKNEFMGIAVHDLKNPLQNILSTARMLRRSKESNETEKEVFISNIISQTDRMFNLIKKLLDHNAIEQGNMKVINSTFRVNDVCTELLTNFKDEASRKDLEIDYHENSLNEEIHTDKEILYEILQNLFSNAIKFSPRGKSITLKSITENDRLKYEITDEGPGFTDSDKQKMFTKFSRLSAKPTGDEHSTGLGLSIVKRLCELIGGDVVLESLENKGSKFVVSLPFHL
jgi:signal transduction histidine kinase